MIAILVRGYTVAWRGFQRQGEDRSMSESTKPRGTYKTLSEQKETLSPA
ncbi:MAG: hypothetical protein AVDCRST_MAG25-674, partial [uncultured Rubrobacteraceae bacterium]